MLRALSRHAGGSVMVEFAICLPLLMLMYLGGYAIADMISCNRKLVVATRALVDMTSRTLSPGAIQLAPSSVSASGYMSASAVVMTPFNVGKATEQVSLIRVCDATHAWVVWTQAQTQTAAQLAAGTATTTTSTMTAGKLDSTSIVAIPATMVTTPMIPVNGDGTTGTCSNFATTTALRTQVGQSGAYLFVAKINYIYTPTYSYGTIGTTPMTDTLYMSPRLV